MIFNNYGNIYGSQFGGLSLIAYSEAYLPETLAYKARVEAVGGTIPKTNLDAINTLYSTLINNSILSKLDTLNVVGYDVAAMKVNLANPTVTASFVNITDSGEDPDFVSNLGVSGGSEKYIDFNINPTTTTNYTGGAGSMFSYITREITPADVAVMGNRIAFNNSNNTIILFTSGVCGTLYSSTHGYPKGEIKFDGFVSVSIDTDEINRLSYDGVLQASVDVSSYYDVSYVRDSTLYGLNAVGVGAPVRTGKIGIFGVGGSLTSGEGSETEILYDALNTYLTTIGAI